MIMGERVAFFYCIQLIHILKNHHTTEVHGISSPAATATWRISHTGAEFHGRNLSLR